MRLKELRIKYEFTQLQIAQVLGMSLYKYRKHEKTGGKKCQYVRRRALRGYTVLSLSLIQI